MADNRSILRTAPALAGPGDDVQQQLRQLGSRAHQLRATARAADHFNALDDSDDRDTGSWLMSCAYGLAAELASEIDGVARALKDQPVDAALQSKVARMRVGAYQLHAAARAADHFLDQDSHDGRDTGSWLIATVLSLAQRLATEIDDNAQPARRPVFDKSEIEAHDAALSRRMAAATAPARGAA